MKFIRDKQDCRFILVIFFALLFYVLYGFGHYKLIAVIALFLTFYLGYKAMSLRYKLEVLSRSIFLVDKETDFIDVWKSNKEDKEYVSLPRTIIETGDVHASLWDARDRGEKSITEEIKKYGDIRHL